MELIKLQNNQIQIASEFVESYKAFQEQKAIMEMREKEFKAELLEYMEQSGIKSFECEGLKITYKAPSVRKSVDSNKLKDMGIYEDVLKESEVKASVTIAIK